MKRKLLRLLPFAALLLTASCTDNQYDLSNINTQSQFKVDGLVVPLNMDPIKLDAIISVGEGDDIKKDPVTGSFYFQKESKEDFSFDDVSVEKITISKPADISHVVTLEVKLSNTIQNNWSQYASDKSISDILNDPGLKGQVGIDDNTEVFTVSINDAKSFNLNASGIDEHITSFKKLGIDPVDLDIDIKLDGIKDLVNEVKISGLTIDLPCGLTVSNNANYSASTGKLSYTEPVSVTNGQKNIKLTVSELSYAAMQADGASFSSDTHAFAYTKMCNVSGTSTIKISDLKGSVKLNNITNAQTTYSCDVKFSKDLVVNSFSGGIDYTIDGIDIDPVNISNLPEFLKDSGTDLLLDNPQLYLDITNPLQANNITAKADLSITRYVQDKPMAVIEKKGLNFDDKENKKVLSPIDPQVEGYTHIAFDGLKDLLRGKDEAGKDRVPDSLEIKVENPVLLANDVKDFELGKKHFIFGKWKFYTELSLTTDTKIGYTKEWNDWQSDDLKDLTVEKATVSFTYSKEVALDAESIEFTLFGTNGQLYGKTTDVQGNAEKQVEITMTGGPVSNITGGKLKVNLKGQGKVLSKDQDIKVSNLRMKVDGHYDKKF